MYVKVFESVHFLFRFQLIWVLTTPLPDLPLQGQELWTLLKVVTDTLVLLCDRENYFVLFDCERTN